MTPTASPKIYCQGDTQIKDGHYRGCQWLAAHLCKSCGLSVCAAHWDSFAGICLACAKVMEGLPQ